MTELRSCLGGTTHCILNPVSTSVHIDSFSNVFKRTTYNNKFCFNKCDHSITVKNTRMLNISFKQNVTVEYKRLD